MTTRRAVLAATPALLAAPALRAQSLTIRQDDQPAPGWRRGVLIRWGDRVVFDALPWDPTQPSVDAAAAQFGWDARILAVFASASPDGVARAVLAVAHPTVDPRMAFPDGRDRPDVAGAMQGVSLLNIENRGDWVVVDGGFQNRRLTAGTLSRVGSDGTLASGLVGVTGGCATPWGSLLLTEGDAATWRARLPGIDPATTGMVVEVDPTNPLWVPSKRAALGRFAPADAAAALSADGRAVVWLTDGRAGGHLYRFVSDDPAGMVALDAGRMAAARIEGGSLRWLSLPEGDPVAGARAAGATSLDRPWGLAFDAARGRLCVALRGGAGSVLELRAAAGDAAAETGVAETLIDGIAVAMPDPRAPAAPVPAWPWAPATLGFDRDGSVLLGTDRGAVPGPLPEALFRVPVEGADRGRAALVLAAPVGAAIGGALPAPDGTLLAAIAHPGAAPGASFAQPATRWPNLRPGEPPRSTVVTLAR
ncbi:PhoX family protein [Roseomonas fluvialis]|uniref:dTDP-glucose 4,6-dehydratase n=1 Tax=Roseomonas fluvialis TaxID=1750527 RepID=A0ABN6P0M4_9PROT|nr:alkaline phosphatase PhoX [Roseomonas fluvialis]BDG71528.1 dTDP-glucose 4,6-dehydratase [Roseomonas fluvialis]